MIHRPLEDEGAYSENDDDFSKSFDSSKQEMTEERRAKLREIEVWESKRQGWSVLLVVMLFAIVSNLLFDSFFSAQSDEVPG